MNSLTIAEFIQQYGRAFTPMDHHYSGPPHTHTAHGTGGPVFPEEGSVLGAFAYKHGGNVLEFGGSVGVSTRYIHEGLDHRNGKDGVVSIDCLHLWALDPDWPRRVPVLCDSRDHRRLLCHFKANNLNFKWAFIDGLHSFDGALNDLTLAILAGCRALIFHDTIPSSKPYDPLTGDGAGVRQAIELGLWSPDWTKVYIDTPCGMTAAFHKEFFHNGSSG